MQNQPNHNNVPRNEYYFHEEWLPQNRRQNVSRLCIEDNKNYICMTNGNALQIYRLINEDLDFLSQKLFQTNFSCLKVVSSPHYPTDYIFLGDDKGGIVIEHAVEGTIYISNLLIRDKKISEIMRYGIAPQIDLQFMDIIVYHKINESKGTVLFKTNDTILNVQFLITKSGISDIKLNSYDLPNTRIRFFGSIVSSKNRLIGIIYEQEEKTILKLHNVDKELRQEWSLQKINLLSFCSKVQGQILILTYDQISIYSLNNSKQLLCNYRTRGSYGMACHLEEDKYFHLGEQLIAFTKDTLKVYGPLKKCGTDILQNNCIVQLSHLGEVSDAGHMISFITITNDLYIVILYENTWRLVHKMPQLSTIESVYAVPSNKNALVVVSSAGVSSFQVSVVERQTPCTFLNEQQYPFLINQLLSLNQGKFLIIGTKEENTVMHFDDESMSYKNGTNLPLGFIIAANLQYLVMENGIYSVDYLIGKFQQILQEEIIVAAATNQQIAYVNKKGLMKWMNCQSLKIKTINNECNGVYCMHFYSSHPALLFTNYNNLQQLTVYVKQQKQFFISIDPIIVSDISHFYYKNNQYSNKFTNRIIEEQFDQNYCFVIGYINGTITIHNSLKNVCIKRIQNNSSNPIIFVPAKQSLIILSDYKQFLFTQQFQIYQLQFSTSNHIINSLAYNPILNAFIFVQITGNSNSIIKVSSIKHLQKKKQCCLRLTSNITITPLLNSTIEVPHALVINNNVYIATIEQIKKYDLNKKEFLKSQTHILKQIVGVEEIALGLLLVGIDLLDRCSALVIDLNNLQIKMQVPLNYRKSPWSIRSISTSNTYFLRHEGQVTCYQINELFQNIQKFTINPLLMGHSLDVNSEAKQIAFSDQAKYVVTYNYNDILAPLCKIRGADMNNGVAYLGKALVTADQAGYINVYEFQMSSPDDVCKLTPNIVAQFYLGEEIFSLRREKDGKVFYTTESGQVGRLQIIEEYQFKLMKIIEKTVLQNQDKKKTFLYNAWRKRKEDKMIDGNLIKTFLNNPPNGKDEIYQNVLQIFNRLTR